MGTDHGGMPTQTTDSAHSEQVSADTALPSPNYSLRQLVGYAAKLGTITGAVVVLGQRSITDFATIVIAILTLGILWRFRLPEPCLVGAAAVAGLVLFPGMRM